MRTEKKNYCLDESILKINKKCNLFISSFTYYFIILCVLTYINNIINVINLKEHFGFDLKFLNEYLYNGIFIFILLISLVWYFLLRIKVFYMLLYFNDESYNYGYDLNLEPKFDNRPFFDKLYNYIY